MKAASLSDIKKEVSFKSAKELQEICLKIGKYSKENKELLTYLLFEKDDEYKYIEMIKLEVEKNFNEINTTTPYYYKKKTRKILRILKKNIKFSKIKTTEAELLIHFCKILKRNNPSLDKDKVLLNIYNRQVSLIKKAISSLHEDLQYDYEIDIENL